MSDGLWLWAEQQDWGGPAEKLVAVWIAKNSDHMWFCTENAARMADYANISEKRAHRILSHLIARDFVVRVRLRDGPAIMLGAAYRHEELVVRFD